MIEEGFPVADLRRIVALDGGGRARAPGVAVVAGDTKVVERGKADGLYVTTAGVGRRRRTASSSARSSVRPGDRVLVSGTLADHGMAVMVARGDLALEADIESDTAPVHELAAALLDLGRRCAGMRDPTRGGLATALNELADAAGLAVVLDEAALPVRPAVHAACEILGIDPLYVANEGKLIAVVAPEAADEALAAPAGAPARRATPRSSARCGPSREGMVLLDTALGGIAHRRHARRRSAAADLLTERHDQSAICGRRSRAPLVEVPGFP